MISTLVKSWSLTLFAQSTLLGMEGALKVGRSTADKARALADPHPDFNRRFDWGGEEKTRFGVRIFGSYDIVRKVRACPPRF